MRNNESKYIGFMLIAIAIILLFVIVPHQTVVKPGERISSRFFPDLCAFGLIMLGVLFLVEGFKKPKLSGAQSQSDSEIQGEDGEYDLRLRKRNFLITVIFLGVYIWLFDILGYILSTLLTISFFLWFLRVRNPLKIATIAGGTTFFMYYVFSVLVKVPLPKGFFK
jgi:putative tricarboxylic transport membrane protein